MNLLELVIELLYASLWPLYLLLKFGSALLLLWYLLMPLWLYIYQPKKGQEQTLEFVDWRVTPCLIPFANG